VCSSDLIPDDKTLEGKEKTKNAEPHRNNPSTHISGFKKDSLKTCWIDAVSSMTQFHIIYLMQNTYIRFELHGSFFK
jgi:hypothetical protein